MIYSAVDIQKDAYVEFIECIPAIVQEQLGSNLQVSVDMQPCVYDEAGKRYISKKECELRGLTYAATIVAKGPNPFIVAQVPLMLDNGTFLVKGQYRVIMLRQKRAKVPVSLRTTMVLHGGKLHKASKKFTPGHTNDRISFAAAEEKFGIPRAMLEHAITYYDTFSFDALDANHMRIMTCNDFLRALLKSCIKQNKRDTLAQWNSQYCTNAIFSSMATGNWKGTGMCGVTQLATLTNETALQSQMRTVVSTSSAIGARYVHPSTCGFYCISDTPEGQSVGLTHSLVDGVRLSKHQKTTPEACGFKPNAEGNVTVFLNGDWIGPCKCATESPLTPEGCRIDIRMHPDGHQDAWIWSDAGRMYRDSFDPTKNMLGRTASGIPFVTHNQTPRISYYCNMAKQAMSCAPPAALPVCHRLAYAQAPLVKPALDETAGVNAIIAVNAMGWNQEDALVFAQGAVDRGLFRSIEHKTYRTKVGSEPQSDMLDRDGLVSEGIQLKENEPFASTELGTSKIAPRSAPTVTVDKVIIAPAEQMATVTTVGMRTPEVGDKFVSRYGQKGVIGRIVPDEDMPFTAEGMRPDIIMNPHAFPSRMTVGQIMEMAGAKINVIRGSSVVDGTPWNETHTVHQLANALAEAGCTRSGKERMYCGVTGEMLPEPIFIAPCWYQRLTHLSREKCYARPTHGPTDSVTGQPTKGRKHAGGIRLGEMERDVLLSTGAIGVLEERNLASGGFTHYQGHQMPHASKVLMQELQGMLIQCTMDSI